ncbi:MAG: hypothetical protein QMD92_07045 [bacterium]|nr:hypothetical protein [bacterium]
MELLKLYKLNEIVIEVILSWAGIILAILTLYFVDIRLVDFDTTMVMVVVFLMVLVNPVFSKFLRRFWKF